MPSLAERMGKKAFEEGKTAGICEGVLQAKKNDLIKQLSLKYGLAKQEKALIEKTVELEKLDKAIELFAVADTKQDVLAALR